MEKEKDFENSYLTIREVINKCPFCRNELRVNKFDFKDIADKKKVDELNQPKNYICPHCKNNICM